MAKFKGWEIKVQKSDLKYIISISVAILIILGLSLTNYLFWKSNKNNKATVVTTADFLKEITENVKKDSPNYYVASSLSNGDSRDATQSKNNTTNSSSASTNTVISSDSSSLETEINLDLNLYQSINTVLNASLGVRIESDTLNKNDIVSTANAATNTKYPAVYYTGTNSDCPQNKICSVNVFTGKIQTIIEEPEGSFIRSVDFNTKNQSLVYAVAPKQEMYGGAYKYNLKTYNLSTKKTVVIVSDRYEISHARWSEDGKNILVGIQGRGIMNPGETGLVGMSILFWNVDTGIKECPPTETAGNGYNAEPIYTFWGEQGKSAVTMAYSGPIEPLRSCDQNGTCHGNELDMYFKPVVINKSDCSWRRINTKDSLVSPHSAAPQLSPIQIGSKILSFNYDVLSYRMDENNPKYSNLNGFYGWINLYDLITGSERDYRKEMGEHVISWITNKNLSKIVYSTINSDTQRYMLKLLDTSSGVVKDLSVPTETTTFNLVGWNGNESNILLWVGSSTFYNVNIESGKLTKITAKK